MHRHGCISGTVYVKGIAFLSDAPVFTLKDAEARNEEKRISHFPDDTITIRNSAERAILTFRYNPLEQMDAVVRSGDTLLIGLEDGIPYIRAKGECRKGMDYDLEKIRRYGLTEGFRPETVAVNPFIIINGTEDYAVMRAIANMTVVIPADGFETAKAVRDAGLRLDVEAPTPEIPSMTAAIEKYLKEMSKPSKK